MKDIDISKLLKESKFNFSRSGGKGGQNVNKVETKAELVFNVVNSYTLTGEAKMLLLKKLKNKIDTEGNFRIYSQTERTQLGNRKKVIEKFTNAIKTALKREPVRIKTKEPVSSKLERLEVKRKHSIKKKMRSEKVYDED
jgi:ribosome-associated protein